MVDTLITIEAPTKAEEYDIVSVIANVVPNVWWEMDLRVRFMIEMASSGLLIWDESFYEHVRGWKDFQFDFLMKNDDVIVTVCTYWYKDGFSNEPNDPDCKTASIELGEGGIPPVPGWNEEASMSIAIDEGEPPSSEFPWMWVAVGGIGVTALLLLLGGKGKGNQPVQIVMPQLQQPQIPPSFPQHYPYQYKQLPPGRG